MGRKASETTQNSNDTFDSRTVNEHTVQWWFKKFCKGDEILEDEERSGQPPEVGKKQLRRSLKLILLQLQEKLLKNSVLTILCHLVFWSKLERWKSSIRGCLMSWPQKKKKQRPVILKCCPLLFYATTTNHFLIRLWHAMKSGFYTTTRNNQLSVWMEKTLQSTSQSQTCPPKRSWSHGLLSVWSMIAFWIPEKLLHLRSILRKLMRCTENWCVQLTLVNKKHTATPDCTLHNQRFKSWTNWAIKFVSSAILPSSQLTTASSSILTTFCRENENAFTTNRR